MKGGFANDQVYEGSDICLDEEEEDFLDGNAEDGRSDDGIWRIGPYSGANQV